MSHYRTKLSYGISMYRFQLWFTFCEIYLLFIGECWKVWVSGLFYFDTHGIRLVPLRLCAPRTSRRQTLSFHVETRDFWLPDLGYRQAYIECGLSLWYNLLYYFTFVGIRQCLVDRIFRMNLWTQNGCYVSKKHTLMKSSDHFRHFKPKIVIYVRVNDVNWRSWAEDS